MTQINSSFLGIILYLFCEVAILLTLSDNIALSCPRTLSLMIHMKGLNMETGAIFGMAYSHILGAFQLPIGPLAPESFLHTMFLFPCQFLSLVAFHVGGLQLSHFRIVLQHFS